MGRPPRRRGRLPPRAALFRAAPPALCLLLILSTATSPASGLSPGALLTFEVDTPSSSSSLYGAAGLTVYEWGVVPCAASAPPANTTRLPGAPAPLPLALGTFSAATSGDGRSITWMFEDASGATVAAACPTGSLALPRPALSRGALSADASGSSPVNATSSAVLVYAAAPVPPCVSQEVADAAGLGADGVGTDGSALLSSAAAAGAAGTSSDAAGAASLALPDSWAGELLKGPSTSTSSGRRWPGMPLPPPAAGLSTATLAALGASSSAPLLPLGTLTFTSSDLLAAASAAAPSLFSSDTALLRVGQVRPAGRTRTAACALFSVVTPASAQGYGLACSGGAGVAAGDPAPGVIFLASRAAPPIDVAAAAADAAAAAGGIPSLGGPAPSYAFLPYPAGFVVFNASLLAVADNWETGAPVALFTAGGVGRGGSWCPLGAPTTAACNGGGAPSSSSRLALPALAAAAAAGGGINAQARVEGWGVVTSITGRVEGPGDGAAVALPLGIGWEATCLAPPPSSSPLPSVSASTTPSRSACCSKAPTSSVTPTVTRTRSRSLAPTPSAVPTRSASATPYSTLNLSGPRPGLAWPPALAPLPRAPSSSSSAAVLPPRYALYVSNGTAVLRIDVDAALAALGGGGGGGEAAASSAFAPAAGAAPVGGALAVTFVRRHTPGRWVVGVEVAPVPTAVAASTSTPGPSPSAAPAAPASLPPVAPSLAPLTPGSLLLLAVDVGPAGTNGSAGVLAPPLPGGGLPVAASPGGGVTPGGGLLLLEVDPARRAVLQRVALASLWGPTGPSCVLPHQLGVGALRRSVDGTAASFGCVPLAAAATPAPPAGLPLPPRAPLSLSTATGVVLAASGAVEALPLTGLCGPRVVASSPSASPTPSSSPSSSPSPTASVSSSAAPSQLPIDPFLPFRLRRVLGALSPSVTITGTSSVSPSPSTSSSASPSASTTATAGGGGVPPSPSVTGTRSATPTRTRSASTTPSTLPPLSDVAVFPHSVIVDGWGGDGLWATTTAVGLTVTGEPLLVGGVTAYARRAGAINLTTVRSRPVCAPAATPLGPSFLGPAGGGGFSSLAQPFSPTGASTAMLVTGGAGPFAFSAAAPSTAITNVVFSPPTAAQMGPLTLSPRSAYWGPQLREALLTTLGSSASQTTDTTMSRLVSQILWLNKTSALVLSAETVRVTGSGFTGTFIYSGWGVALAQANTTNGLVPASRPLVFPSNAFYNRSGSPLAPMGGSATAEGEFAWATNASFPSPWWDETVLALRAVPGETPGGALYGGRPPPRTVVAMEAVPSSPGSAPPAATPFAAAAAAGPVSPLLITQREVWGLTSDASLGVVLDLSQALGWSGSAGPAPPLTCGGAPCGPFELRGAALAPLPTPVPSPTPSPSTTPSRSVSPSGTPTGTLTGTLTGTRSPMPSVTPSSTPSRSGTPSPSKPRPSATRTASPSPSVSGSPSYSPSASASGSASPSASASMAPSGQDAAPTSSTEAEALVSPSASLSAAASGSPTPSSSRSRAATRSTTPSPTPSRSGSVPPSAEPTPTATLSEGASPSAPSTPTATATVTASLSGTARATRSAGSGESGEGSTATPSPSRSPSGASTASASAAGSATTTATAVAAEATATPSAAAASVSPSAIASGSAQSTSDVEASVTATPSGQAARSSSGMPASTRTPVAASPSPSPSTTTASTRTPTPSRSPPRALTLAAGVNVTLPLLLDASSPLRALLGAGGTSDAAAVAAFLAALPTSAPELLLALTTALAGRAGGANASTTTATSKAGAVLRALQLASVRLPLNGSSFAAGSSSSSSNSNNGRTLQAASSSSLAVAVTAEAVVSVSLPASPDVANAYATAAAGLLTSLNASEAAIGSAVAAATTTAGLSLDAAAAVVVSPPTLEPLSLELAAALAASGGSGAATAPSPTAGAGSTSSDADSFPLPVVAGAAGGGVVLLGAGALLLRARAARRRANAAGALFGGAKGGKGGAGQRRRRPGAGGGSTAAPSWAALDGTVSGEEAGSGGLVAPITLSASPLVLAAAANAAAAASSATTASTSGGGAPAPPSAPSLLPGFDSFVAAALAPSAPAPQGAKTNTAVVPAPAAASVTPNPLAGAVAAAAAAPAAAAPARPVLFRTAPTPAAAPAPTTGASGRKRLFGGMFAGGAGSGSAGKSAAVLTAVPVAREPAGSDGLPGAAGGLSFLTIPTLATGGAATEAPSLGASAVKRRRIKSAVRLLKTQEEGLQAALRHQQQLALLAAEQRAAEAPGSGGADGGAGAPPRRLDPALSPLSPDRPPSTDSEGSASGASGSSSGTSSGDVTPIATVSTSSSSSSSSATSSVASSSASSSGASTPPCQAPQSSNTPPFVVGSRGGSPVAGFAPGPPGSAAGGAAASSSSSSSARSLASFTALDASFRIATSAAPEETDAGGAPLRMSFASAPSAVPRPLSTSSVAPLLQAQIAAAAAAANAAAAADALRPMTSSPGRQAAAPPPAQATQQQ